MKKIIMISLMIVSSSVFAEPTSFANAVIDAYKAIEKKHPDMFLEVSKVAFGKYSTQVEMSYFEQAMQCTVSASVVKEDGETDVTVGELVCSQ